MYVCLCVYVCVCVCLFVFECVCVYVSVNGFVGGLSYRIRQRGSASHSYIITSWSSSLFLGKAIHFLLLLEKVKFGLTTFVFPDVDISMVV